MGAKAVNPNINVTARWVGTDVSAFSDPARAKEAALALAGQGVDQIFAAAAASNFGIFEAAKDKKFFAYGVDVNQCPSAPGFIVDNLLKRVDVETVKAIDAIVSNSKEQVQVYGLAEGGIGIVPFALDNPQASQCEIMKHQDVIDKVKDLQTKITSGELKIKDPMFP
jgi:basic membrane protein A